MNSASALSFFLGPPKTPVVSKQLSELSAFLDKPAPVSSDIAAFLVSAQNQVKKPVVEKTSVGLDPNDLLAMIRGQKGIGSQQAVIQKSPNNIHAEQLRQITSDFRAGHSSTSYPVLPVALRLSHL
jgi:hypothetical protein